jgi:hypothetical protein
MNDKNYFDDFRKSYSINDKYSNLGSYMKVDKYGSYSALEDFLGYYKADKSKKQETPQERDARLLREKAEAREVKIDQILKK